MMPSPYFTLRTERLGDQVVVVTIAGELDFEHSAEVRDALRAAVLDPDHEAVIADLSRLEFIDSMGLTALVDAARILRKAKRPDLIVVGGGVQVRRVLTICQLDRIVRLVDTLDEGAPSRRSLRSVS